MSPKNHKIVGYVAIWGGLLLTVSIWIFKYLKCKNSNFLPCHFALNICFNCYTVYCGNLLLFTLMTIKVLGYAFGH